MIRFKQILSALAILVASAFLAIPVAQAASKTPFPIPTGEKVGTTNPQVVCLADAIHYEAGNSAAGYASVAMAIFARVKSGVYGPSICHAVYAYRLCSGHRCKARFHYGRNPHRSRKGHPVAQFSYTTAGKPWPWRGNAANRAKWRKTTLPTAKRLYADWMKGTTTVAPKVQHKLAGCDYFHNFSVKPKWRHGMERTCGKVAGHMFYASADAPTRAAALAARNPAVLDGIQTSSIAN